MRICTHYFAHGAWLDDGQQLRDAHRLKGIPGILIHGRLDLSGPLLNAWELAQAWPDAELKIIEDSGHTGSPAMRTAVLDAIARFDPVRSHFSRCGFFEGRRRVVKTPAVLLWAYAERRAVD